MAETNENLFVARESDLAALRAHVDAAREGDGRTVLVEAPMGGGKRALVGEVVRKVTAGEEDVIAWRVPLLDEEDGLRALLRFYASLYAVLHRSPLLRTKVEMVLNAQMPRHQRRTQAWLQAFIDGLKKGPKPGEETFQVSLPRDNPLVGLVEVVAAISSKIPVILEIQNVHFCQSLALPILLEALMDATAGKTRLCVILETEIITDDTRAIIPAPLEDFLKRREGAFHRLGIAPWAEAEVSAFLASKGLHSDAARIAEITAGRPGFVAELVDILNERNLLDGDLSGKQLIDFVPTTVDEAELEGDDGSEEEAPVVEGEPAQPKRRAATVADAPVLHHVAALLGSIFPSTLLADIAGFKRDSVDDMLDACSDLYEEVQYNKAAESWLYQFKHGLYRFGVLEANRDPAGRERAARVGRFMEQVLAPRGYEFLMRTLSVYGFAGDIRRASLVKGIALGSDRPELWAMVHELLGFYTGSPWPDIMRRTVFMNLLERMVQLNAVEAAEKLYNEAIAWAGGKSDRAMEAWVLLAGSRLDYRRQDLYRARDRAKDALTLFNAQEDKAKIAEVLNHLAMVELSDGNPAAAIEHVDNALKVASGPQVQAHAAFVHGLVAKRDRKFDEAIEHFKKANEFAGSVGNGPLALEAGINLGETLLVHNQHSKAADVLGRCVQIAQALKNPVRERAASALLGQAHAAQRQFQAALTSARSTLELSRKLKFQQLLAPDTYNVAFFTLMMGNANEATSLFRQALETADPADPMLYKEIQYNLGVALRQVGETRSATEAFKAAIEPARQSKDWRKVVGAHKEMAEIAKGEGDLSVAKAILKSGIAIAEQQNMAEERKVLKRLLESF